MICVENVSKTYTIRSLQKGKLLSYGKTDIPALRKVSFSISDGECVGYVGLNGSGKSTTIKLLCGILCPDSGEVRVNGANPFGNKKLCYDIGVVFGQKQQLWMDLPVGDSFGMLRSIYHISPADYRAQLEMLDNFLDVTALFPQPARKLSLGQRMKCEFAASLLHAPKILLLDEPTIGVDIHVRQQILFLLRYLRRERGITVFLTTHNLSDIEELCDRIILLNHGVVFYDGIMEGLNRATNQCGKIIFHPERPVDAASLAALNQGGCTFQLNELGELVASYPQAQPGAVVDIINLVQQKLTIRRLTIEECKLENIINELFVESSEPGAAGKGKV